MINQLNILGTRGIPASHGGFETFAASLAPYVRDKGWKVSVYCQNEDGAPFKKTWTDTWRGIQRVHIATRFKGPFATVEFDLKCIWHVLRQPGVDLVLGYNTAILTLLQRLFGRRVVMNMDGIEWKRQKWKGLAKTWLQMNEWIGSRCSSVVIADHPEIQNHLKKRGCTSALFIPYGADPLVGVPTGPIEAYDLVPGQYFLVIARTEPENSILEIVKAFSQATTGKKLVFLGRLSPDSKPYHRQIVAAANGDVLFLGAIYDQSIVNALRAHCLAYIHGHQVGGTNPSLVEALAAGNAVIAHDNKFNRWVAGPDQLYFTSVDECAQSMEDMARDFKKAKHLGGLSRIRHSHAFQLDDINRQYFETISPHAEDVKIDALQPQQVTS